MLDLNPAGGDVFGRAPDLYDAGRLPTSAAASGWIVERAGLRAGARVLEVGAGSGQLTGRLLAAGLRPTCLEPSAALGAMLTARYGGMLDVQPVGFEAYTRTGPGRRYAAVLAANSWHWVDPAAGYAGARRVLSPGGALGIVYSVSVAEPAAQRVVDDILAGRGIGELARPAGFLDAADAALDDVCDAVEGGGFSVLARTTATDEHRLDAAAYGRLVASYGPSIARGAGAAGALADALAAALARVRGEDPVRVTDRTYALVARPA